MAALRSVWCKHFRFNVSGSHNERELSFMCTCVCVCVCVCVIWGEFRSFTLDKVSVSQCQNIHFDYSYKSFIQKLKDLQNGLFLFALILLNKY